MRYIIYLFVITSFICCDSHISTNETGYELAMSAYKEKDYSSVINLTSALLEDQLSAKVIADTYYLRGYVYQTLGSKKLAHKDFLLARDGYAELDDIEKLAKISNDLGNLFYGVNSYSHAQKYYSESLAYAKDISIDKHIANALYGKGITLKRQGHLILSLSTLYQAMELEKSLERFNRFLDVKLEISIVHFLSGNYSIAMEKNWEIINAVKGSDLESYYYGKCYNNIGANFLALENFEKSTHFLNLSLEMSGRRNSQIAVTFNNLGKLSNELGNPIAAADYFKSAIKLNKNNVDLDEVATTIANMNALLNGTSDKDSVLYYYKQIAEIAIAQSSITQKINDEEVRSSLEGKESSLVLSEMTLKNKVYYAIFIGIVLLLIFSVAFILRSFPMVSTLFKKGRKVEGLDPINSKMKLREEENALWLNQIN